MSTQVSLLPPEGFDFAHPDSWTKWEKCFERYRLASGLLEKDEAIQVSALIYTMGDAVEKVFDSFGLRKQMPRSMSCKIRSPIIIGPPGLFIILKTVPLNPKP